MERRFEEFHAELSWSKNKHKFDELLNLIGDAAKDIPQVWDDYRNVAHSDSIPKFVGIMHILKEFDRQDRSNGAALIEFFLRSFLFILTHRDYWSIIVEFTTGDFAKINKDIEIIHKDPTRKSDFEEKSQKWYEMMTSTDLPIVPHELILTRCNFSVKGSFDWLTKPYVDSYRTTSTSILPEPECIGKPSPETNAKIYMYIKCLNLPGLCVGFKDLTEFDEFEVVLPPGVRYSWQDKAHLYVPLDIRVGKDARFPYLEESQTMMSEYKSKDEAEEGEFYEYYRAYDASFIEEREIKTEAFPNVRVAERMKTLMLFTKKLERIFEKHKIARALSMKVRVEARG
jgi:hypothetical protein